MESRTHDHKALLRSPEAPAACLFAGHRNLSCVYFSCRVWNLAGNARKKAIEREEAKALAHAAALAGCASGNIYVIWG